jgi:hypothetical protein
MWRLLELSVTGWARDVCLQIDPRPLRAITSKMIQDVKFMSWNFYSKDVSEDVSRYFFMALNCNF